MTDEDSFRELAGRARPMAKTDDSKIPNVVTLREKYGPAMEIETQEQADAYFERCVEHHLRAFSETGISREKAEGVERENLGYYAGYYDHPTRIRVDRLFKCTHPLLGAAKDHEPTAEECFAIGQEWDVGRRMSEREGYQVDPGRVELAETGIYIRAQLNGKWGSHDLMHLDADSALRWLTGKRALQVAMLLLGHDPSERGGG